MLPNNMSSRMAQIANQVADRGGSVDEEEMDRILTGYGVTRQKAHYKRMLVTSGYLYHDDDRYTASAESVQTATITITVRPSLFAEEVRRYTGHALALHEGIVEVSEVEL